jgi:hypothetical protein
MIPNGPGATARSGAGLAALGPAARPMALGVLIIRVPRSARFTAHIVLRYGQEGVDCRRWPGL